MSYNVMNFSHDELEVIEMSEKKESIFSKLFKPSKSCCCCCCSVEIVDEDRDKDEAAQDKEEKEKESK